MAIGSDAAISGREPGRQPSRLLAAYAKAAERARLEALADSDGQRIPPPRAANPASAAPPRVVEPVRVAAKPRPVVAASRGALTPPGRRALRPQPRLEAPRRRVSWIIAVSACLAVVAIWQTRTPREATINAEAQ